MADWTEVRNPHHRVEGVAESARVVERSLAETCFIVTAALESTGESVEEAKRLLRKVALRYFGQTWGKSLFVTGGGEALPPWTEVVATILSVAEVGVEEWEDEVVFRTERQMLAYPNDIPLYLSQIADLAGPAAVLSFWKHAAGAVRKPEEKLQVQADALYQTIAGLSYWEMDRNRVALFLLDCYAAWKRLSGVHQRARLDLRDGVAASLTQLRNKLRRLANVVLNRDLVHRDEFIEAGNGVRVSYDELVSLLD